jgi:hypothetical protein
MSVKSKFPYKICHECLNSIKDHECHTKTKNKRPQFTDDEEKRHYFTINQEKNEMDKNLDKISLLVKSFSQTVNDHFENVRKEIDLRREILLRQVHNKSNELIRRANLKEESLFKKLNEKIIQNKDEFENDNKALIKLNADGELDLRQIDEFKRRYNEKLNEIESLIDSGLSSEFGSKIDYNNAFSGKVII